jgi:hypothetical protein
MKRREPANADDKLPRGHAYIHVRNHGETIHIDYPEIDSAQAGRVIDAAMAIVREDLSLQDGQDASEP